MSKAPDSLAEQVARKLSQRIILGQLQGGERIRELHVAEQMGVSRGVVREALLILQRWHLVDIHTNRSAQVSQLNAEDVRGLYDLTLELQVLQVCAVIDNWRDPAELQPLRDIRQHLAEGLQSGKAEAFLNATWEMSRVASSIARNPFVQQTLQNLHPMFSRTHQLSLESRQQEMQYFYDIYCELLGAVEGRQRHRVRELLQDFMRHSCELALVAIERQGQGACA